MYSRFGRPVHSIDEVVAQYDRLRRMAACKMGMGADVPGQFASILRLDNAAPPRHEKSLVRASCHKSLKFEDASANMQRLFGSRGSGRRQDDLLTEEAVEPRVSDEDLDVLAAYGKAKKPRGGGEVNGWPTKKGRGQGQRRWTITEWT